MRLIVVLLLLQVTCFGQKEILGITGVNFVKKKDRGFSKQINDVIVKEFTASNRFKVVDRTNYDAISKERELQKTEDFIDGKVIEQGKSLGAKYITVAEVSNIISNQTLVFGSYQYHIQIFFGIKILDVETSEVVSSKSFGNIAKPNYVPCESSGYGSNLEAAIQSSMANFSCGLKKWIFSSFPIEINFLKIEEAKKGKALSILIEGGQNVGLTNGMILEVFENSEELLSGKLYSRKIMIGEVSVRQIENNNLSMCKVNNGEKEIFNAVNSGKKLTLNLK